jgi:S-adenosylmethionine-diacylgycerolhomoserine-N-methlytransferase
MSLADVASEARLLLRLLQGLPRQGSHADRLAGFYAPQAGRYDHFRKRLLHGREDLIRMLAIQPGMRVVELGCGTGSNLEHLKESVEINTLARVELVDLCPPLLELARKRAVGHDNIDVIEADASTWQPEHAADRVFLTYALTMMPNWEAVLDNAYTLLAPGGCLGIVDFHLPATLPRWQARAWKHWFAHDGVRLSDQHLAALKQRFAVLHAEELLAPLPYLPGVRVPYYRFVGRKTGA